MLDGTLASTCSLFESCGAVETNLDRRHRKLTSLLDQLLLMRLVLEMSILSPDRSNQSRVPHSQRSRSSLRSMSSSTDASTETFAVSISDLPSGSIPISSIRFSASVIFSK